MSSSERLYQGHAFDAIDAEFEKASKPASAAPRRTTPHDVALAAIDKQFADAAAKTAPGPAAASANPAPAPLTPAPDSGSPGPAPFPVIHDLAPGALTTPAARDASTRAPGKPRDIQREADPLERVLNAWGSIGLYPTAGAVRGMFDRGYAPGPIEGAKRGIQEHATFGDWIGDAIPEEYRALRVPSSMPLPGGSMPVGAPTLSDYAHLAGLPLDVGLDWTTYLGGGLTKAGELAKAEEVARRFTLLHGEGEAADLARATQSIAKPAFEEGAAALPARIRAGQEGVQFAGKVVAPELQARAVQGVHGAGAAIAGSKLGKKTVEQLEPVIQALASGSDAMRQMFTFAPELSGIDREVFLQRLAEKRAATTRAVSEMERDTRELRSGLADAAEAHGITPKAMRRVMSDTVELTKVPDGADLTAFMTPDERRKYVRWAYEANAAQQGFGTLQPQLEHGVTWMGSRPGGQPNPVSRLEQKSERTAELMGKAAEPVIEKIPGSGVANAGGSTRRGNPYQLTMVSPFQHSEAWLPHRGTMPDELARHLAPNSARRVREFEARATARAQALQLSRAIKTAMRIHVGSDTRALAARAQMRPGLKELVTKINAINAAALSSTRAEGVVVSELDDVINYMRRQMTPEGRRAMDKFGPEDYHGISREVTERHAEQARRSFRGMTTTEINDLARAGKLQILGNHAVPEGIFHEDPFVATGFRVSHAQEAIESAQILKDYARLYGQAEATAPKTWVHVPSDLPELQHVMFPPDVGQALARSREAIQDPSGFLKAWDEVHRVWKKYTLPIIPAYHGRNEIGDVWNAVVLGDMHPRWFAPSTEMLFGGGKTSSYRIGAKQYSGSKLLEMAEASGAINTGQVAELQRDLVVLKQTPEGALRKLGDAIDHNAAVEWAQRFGQARENTTRFGMFLDRLAKGYSPQAAAGDVRKFLFDYGQLTGAEKGITRLIPFYQWTRRNVPLQISYLFRKPGAFGAFQHARDEAAQGQPLAAEGEPLPRFLAEGLPFPAGTNAEGNPQYLRGLGVLPFADLGQDPSQLVVNQLSPYITAPYEMARNLDLFKSDIPHDMEPLERAPGETSNYLGLSVPRRIQPAIDLIPGARLATELDRANPFHMFGSEQQGPIWNPGTPRDYPDPDPTLRLLRILGARPYAYRPDKAAKALDRDVKSRRRELEDLRDDALDRGHTQNADAYQRELDRIDEKPERARK